MTRREFARLANELFGELLHPFGFTNAQSKGTTFYREVRNDVFHFIMPDIGSRGVWYDIKVFPHSPALDPLFHQRFPDQLGIPTDSWSLLSEVNGVNRTQQTFNCKYEEHVRNTFASSVGPLLISTGIPYLDRFQTVADIIPAIRHPSFLGFALYHVGRFDEAQIALHVERERLRRFDRTNQDVATRLVHIERLLESGFPN